MIGDYYCNQRILVTGGAGVIGSVLVEALVRAGAHVLSCDLKPRPEQFEVAVQHVQGDANYLTYDQIQSFAPTMMFHLAATFERSIETEEFWWENYWHNIRLGNHLMSVVKQVPEVKRVVFASSYLIYAPDQYCFDKPQATPRILSENTPIYPRNICGAAKLLHELELRFLEGFDQCAFTTISARIFRVYGKDSRDIISRWINLLVKNPEAELPVYREEEIFDYIYADDVAQGLMHLGASDATGISNLGSGHGRTVSDLINVLRQHFPGLCTRSMDVDIPYEAHQADLTRLKALTDWCPSTTLESGVHALVNYYQGCLETLPQEDVRSNILISSASRKAPLVKSFRSAFLRTAEHGGVVVGDTNANCIAGYFADESWVMPKLDQLSVERLIAECRVRKVILIVPTRDGELEYFARARPALEEAGIGVHIAEPEQVRSCFDKLAFYHCCRDAGIPVIPTFNNPDTFAADARIVVKECFGAGSRSIGLGLTVTAAAQHASRLDTPVFQPFIVGKEYSIDLYVNRGKEVVEVVPRRRNQVLDGESVVSETVEAPALVKLSIALVKLFSLRGHNVLQALVQPDGEVVFVECNPRVGGASTLSFEAGLDTPYWSLLEARGGYVAPRIGQYRRGLKLIRYNTDRFIET